MWNRTNVWSAGRQEGTGDRIVDPWAASSSRRHFYQGLRLCGVQHPHTLKKKTNTQHPAFLTAFSLSYITALNRCYQRIDLSVFSLPIRLPPVYVPQQGCLESFLWQLTVDRQHLWCQREVLLWMWIREKHHHQQKCQNSIPLFKCWVYWFIFFKSRPETWIKVEKKGSR